MFADFKNKKTPPLKKRKGGILVYQRKGGFESANYEQQIQSKNIEAATNLKHLKNKKQITSLCLFVKTNYYY